MMSWNGNGMNGWGYGLMTISMVMFWALLIAGSVVLVLYLGRPGPRSLTAQPAHRTPEQILAGRFAHGDISDDEYRQRADLLRSHLNT